MKTKFSIILAVIFIGVFSSVAFGNEGPYCNNFLAEISRIFQSGQDVHIFIKLPEFYYNPDCFRVPEADSTVYGKYRLTTTPPVKKSDMTIVAEDLFFDPSLACRVFGSMPKVYEFHITHFCVDPGRYIYNLESYDFQDFLDEKIDSYTNYSSRRIDVVDSKTYCDESYCEISACNLRENEDEDWLCALGNNNQTYYILFAYIVGVIYLMKSRKQH